MDRVTQPDYVDGRLVFVGAEDETVPVHFQEGDTIHKCRASVETARKIASHLNATSLRAFGTATWLRHSSGVWELEEFVVDDFMLLDEKSLAEVLSSFENLPSPDWHEDPMREIDIDWKEWEKRSR
jgi:hypothetical protein